MSDTPTLTTLDAEMAAVLEAVEPVSVLRVTAPDVPETAVADVRHHDPEDAASLMESAAGSPVDLALLDSRAALAGEEVRRVLSRLRDLLARRVLVLVRPDAGADWARSVLISCGYTHHARCTHGDGTVELYQFDIATYKPTPDWLGPSNWANPELWDKYRW